MQTRWILALLLALVWMTTGAHAQAVLIPTERLAPWEVGVTVGVPGGIPTNRTQCVTTECVSLTNAPVGIVTGVDNATPLIQAAINSAVADTYVLIPAGTFRLNTHLIVGPTRDSITLRGASRETTILDCRSAYCVFVGSSSDFLWNQPTSGNTLTAPITASGSSSVLTVSTTAAYTVGQTVKVAFENDPTVPIMTTSGFPWRRAQFTRITAKTSTTLTVFPAIYGYARFAGLDTTVYHQRNQTDLFGIEDITFDGGNAVVTYGLFFDQTYGNWVEDVIVKRTRSYHVYLFDSLQCEVRHSKLDELNHTGPRGAGMLLANVSGCLIEDNLILQAMPAIIVDGPTSGNVIAYNFMRNDAGSVGIDSNHAPHSSFNLYEGNVVTNIMSDGYFGSESELTIYRNLLHANGETGFGTLSFCFALKRFTRNASLVGNLLGGSLAPACYSYGTPNLGNNSYTGTAQPSLGDWWADYGPPPATTNIRGQLTTRTDSLHGVITLSSGDLLVGDLAMTWPDGSGTYGTYVRVVSINGAQYTVDSVPWQTALPALNTLMDIWPGSGGYQELDLDVEASTVLKANNYQDGGIPVGEALTTEVFPASLFRTEKPAYFGTLTWPAVDPTDPDISYEIIPAGFRYVNSIEVPEEVVIPDPPPIVITVSAGDLLTWEQEDATLAEAQDYVYRLYIDGATEGQRLIGVTCSAGTPVTCSAPFPTFTPGPHTLQHTASSGPVESAPSSALEFVYTRTTPTQPTSTAVK